MVHCHLEGLPETAVWMMELISLTAGRWLQQQKMAVFTLACLCMS